MSSGSESDEEYVPGEPEQVSEEDSADEVTDLQLENEAEHKTKKRKSNGASNSGKKKRPRKSNKAQIVEPEETPDTEIEKIPANPEEEKKREDDLWAKFLEGTESKPKPVSKIETKPAEAPIKLAENKKTELNSTSKDSDDSKDRERRIFEFAGETIVVENNVIKEKIQTAQATATVSNQGPSRNRRSGDLSGVLGQLKQKNQLSTLEKSKLDWLTYKKVEGIEEEIQNHNKGKSGYLDRQDFLQRADLRQYEAERDIRMSRRSNR